jgi:hypothetical protein
MPVGELTDDLDVLVLEFLSLLGQAIKTGVGRVHSSKVIQFAMPKAKEKP